MRTFSSIALVVGVAIVLAAASPTYAATGHGGGGSSEHSGGAHFDGHPGFEGHHDVDRHRDFDRRGRVGAFIGTPFYGDYPDSYAPSSYWYYCPSYGAYYPTVPSCPDAWVPVPG
jgi:hypothetical protein